MTFGFEHHQAVAGLVEGGFVAHALGMRVIAVRRTPTGSEPCETWPVARLGELLAIADDVVRNAAQTQPTV